MQCSTKNFLASQALYGLMIAHPRWSRRRLVREAQLFAKDMMKEEKKLRCVNKK